MDDKKERDPIPEQFNSLKEAGEFWDTHSFEDYLDLVEEVDVEFDIKQRLYYIPLEEDLYALAKARAKSKEQSVEQLIKELLARELYTTPTA
ncbi:MAG: CopG family antitoxin [Caldilineaceae bacterium]|nr:hypothetical protein [Caldilineaceae bacterium]